MGWVTLSLRKQTLRAEISSNTFESLQLSREKRQLQRHLNYEKSLFDHKKQGELSAAKAPVNAKRDERPDDVNSDKYSTWKEQYNQIQDAYNSKKQDIEDYYDEISAQLEEEANEREQAIQEQMDELEVQRQDMQAEFDAIKDQIKTEIQNSAISF